MPRHRLTEIDSKKRSGVCSVCGPVGIKVRTRQDFVEYMCNTMVNERARRYYQKNKELYKKWARFPDGRSTEERAAQAALQENKCAICRRKRKLVGDHCHRTGKARGMLCQQCNSMLGMARDDPAVLIAAIQYLKKYTAEKELERSTG